MKFYIELDGTQFIIEADRPTEAIAALWERRADTCRNLDDILPEYWIHAGNAAMGGCYVSLPAYWLLSQSAQHVVYHVLASHMDQATFSHCCEIILSHHPAKV